MKSLDILNEELRLTDEIKDLQNPNYEGYRIGKVVFREDTGNYYINVVTPDGRYSKLNYNKFIDYFLPKIIYNNDNSEYNIVKPKTPIERIREEVQRLLKPTNMYKEYRVNGPYISRKKNGTLYLDVIIYNDIEKIKVSFGKFLMEIKLGRYLEDNETVDHIDKNPLNNNYDNLQVLDRTKHVKLDAHRLKDMNFNCLNCEREITLKGKQLNNLYNKIKAGGTGPFCNNSCGTHYQHKVQNGKIERFQQPLFEREYYDLKGNEYMK